MTNPEQAPDEAPTAGEPQLEFEVQRDMRFVRFAADDIFVFGRAEDIILSIIEQGPSPVAVRPPSGNVGSVGRGQLGLQPTFTEVSQAVIGPRAAVAMALQVLEYCIAAGHIDVADLRARITAMLDRHDGSDQRSQSEETGA